jgi:phage tail-like protein
MSLSDLMVFGPEADPPVTFNFMVQIDNIAGIMMWTSVSGLSLSVSTKSNQKGTNNNQTALAVVRGAKTSGKLTLTRPLGPSSQDIFNWVQQVDKPGNALTPTSGVVALFDPVGQTMYEWELSGVMPTDWSIAKFDASQTGSVIEETLTLSYKAIDFSVSQYGD